MGKLVFDFRRVASLAVRIVQAAPATVSHLLTLSDLKSDTTGTDIQHNGTNNSDTGERTGRV